MIDSSIQHSHRRRNPLTGDWVLVSPQRLRRPWQGAAEQPADLPQIEYDPDCYLCPGNQRADGATNPRYEQVYVFDNDFPALESEATSPDSIGPLFEARAVCGTCRVICFSPHHSRTLSELDPDETARVAQVWVEQTQELGGRYPGGSVQIFENKGALMGCSNPHPHGQVWAQDEVPSRLKKALELCAAYFAQHDRPMLADYLEAELADGARLVCQNPHFVALVPYWASWPYETLVLPRRSVAALPQLTAEEISALGDIVQRVSQRYDQLFKVRFPYSAGFHQAPLAVAEDASFTLHMHFYPPLLRSASVRKFMVGYEMLAEPQRDLTPEAAAALLREQPELALTP
ncbi:MAG: UDP-glucose--hexose-1-phosphate uridylyltransferase [Pseudomonadota bacterium]